MQVMSIIELNSTPSISATIGGYGSQQFLDNINKELSGGTGVFFGSANDRYRDHYEVFQTQIVAPNIEAARIVRNACRIIRDTINFTPITSMDILKQGVPVEMELPILLYKPVLEQFKEGNIYGFGYEYKNVENQEDVWGRLISNGCADITGPNAKDYIEWEWKSTDPIHTLEDIENVEATRMFIDDFMDMHSDIDFTDPSLGKRGRIK